MYGGCFGLTELNKLHNRQRNPRIFLIQRAAEMVVDGKRLFAELNLKFLCRGGIRTRHLFAQLSEGSNYNHYATGTPPKKDDPSRAYIVAYDVNL